MINLYIGGTGKNRSFKEYALSLKMDRQRRIFFGDGTRGLLTTGYYGGYTIKTYL
jgi:hypothetical protein